MLPMDLVALVLAALAALPQRPGGTEESRRIAVEGIVAAAFSNPLFEGSSDRSAEIAATALMLAAIGQHESSFDPRVGQCAIRGGGAISYFQLLGDFSLGGHTKTEICSSPALAAQLALRVLHLQKSRCKRCAPAGWLSGYASGRPDRPSRASRETAKVLDLLAKSARLTIAIQAQRPPVWVK